ncbi:MAG: hypothetical protein AB1831_00480, partial [Pseudomonadota bacterium]
MEAKYPDMEVTWLDMEMFPYLEAPSKEGLQNLPARLPGWDNSDMKQMSLEAPMYTGFELRAKRTRKRA